MRLAIGDIIQYHKEFGVVAAYNKQDCSYGIQWFVYSDIWWYDEAKTTLFRKVS
jgi:hypothetical protein